jgi:hypothetical protein
MSDPTDIAARTQRFRDAARAFTPPPPKRYAKLMPLKEGIVELREKGASLRLIRELLATVDVSVSIDTIARFLAEVKGEITAQRRTKKSGPRHQIISKASDGQSTPDPTFTEPPPAGQQTASPQQTVAPSGRPRIRGPRIADPHNL